MFFAFERFACDTRPETKMLMVKRDVLHFKFRFVACCVILSTLTGCFLCRNYHSKTGIERSEKIEGASVVIGQRAEEKDRATGLLLRIADEAKDVVVSELAKSTLMEAYPDPEPSISKGDATEAIVRHCGEKLEEAESIVKDLKKITLEAKAIKKDFQATLEKEIKLSQYQMVGACLGGAAIIWLVLNLLMGGIVAKFKK